MNVYLEALSSKQSFKREFHGIALTKFLCSLLVISAHVHPLMSYGSFANYISDTIGHPPVPLYFVASGYFLFRKTNYEDFETSRPIWYVKKILKLYLIWSAIYFPIVWKTQISVSKYGIPIAILIWLRNFFLTGSYRQLWYLNALIVAVLLITFLLKRKISYKKIVLLAFLLYVIALPSQTYFGLLKPLQKFSLIWKILKIIEAIIGTTRNGVFFGFLFVGIGMLFAYHPIVMPFRYALTGFIISTVLLLSEATVVWKMGWIHEQDMYIFLIPFIFFLFYVVSFIRSDSNDAIYMGLQTIGTINFYIHMLVKYGIEFVFPNIHNSILLYLLVTFSTCLFSTVIYQAAKIPKFQWLKKLYT